MSSIFNSFSFLLRNTGRNGKIHIKTALSAWILFAYIHQLLVYDQKYEVDSWKQMLLQTCALLNRMNPMLFASLESDPDLQGRKRPYFSRDGIGLDTPAKIPDADLYVETHVSARYLKKMIANLLGKYDIPEEAYLIYLKKDFTPLHEENFRIRRALPVQEEPQQDQEEQLSFNFDSEGNWNG